MNHQIRICKESEYEKLIDFIKKYWNENHIFTKSKKMLDFQHLDRKKNNYNFIVALNENTKEFDAVLGFIPLSLYDENLQDNEFWLAIWKAKQEHSGLGLKIFIQLQNELKIFSLGASGISSQGLPFYKAMHFKVGIMQHFYIKNPQLRQYKIAFFNTQYFAKEQDENVLLKELSWQEFELSNLIYSFYPQKSLKYFVNRYSKHPFYTYTLYGLYTQKILKSVFITREQKTQGAKCLRIVDFIGEFVPNCKKAFEKLLIEKTYEYVDLLVYLYDYNPIFQMGFTKKDSQDLVPNYFEPFEMKNIDIHCAYKFFQETKNQNYAFFKADADQDRPSIILARGGGYK